MAKRLTRGQLAEYQGSDRVISTFELNEILKQQKSEGFVINSGIPSLDRFTEGFREGELIIVSGPTGNGKTLLAQSLTAHFCGKDEEPLWFTFEVPPRQFLRSFPELPYFYMPGELKSGSMDWFEDRVIESFEKHQNKLIIIDNLHFLVDMFRIRNPSLEIGACVRRLKRFAVENGFVIFLICHIHKIPEGTKASHHHIRDSSFVSQEADTVLMIQRIVSDDGRKNRAMLTVDKCRWSGIFGEVVNVHRVNGYLKEAALEP
jgi:replicative DNA helicase